MIFALKLVRVLISVLSLWLACVLMHLIIEVMSRLFALYSGLSPLECEVVFP